MANKDNKLDTEEQEILDTFNRGEWLSKGENLDKYKSAAKQTFAKTHRINLRVSEKDFRGIHFALNSDAFIACMNSSLQKMGLQKMGSDSINF